MAASFYHYVVTKDTVTAIMQFYLNGMLVKSGTGLNNALVVDLDVFRLGCSGAGDSFYDGMVDDFRIYDKVLGAAEIQELAGVTFFSGHWSFDDGSPNDISGYDRSGILMGDAQIVYDEQRDSNVLWLDGDGDYMDLGDANWTNPDGVFTIAAWIKADNFDTAYQTVLAKGDQTYRLSKYGDTSNSMSIYVNSDSSFSTILPFTSFGKVSISFLKGPKAFFLAL